MEETFSVRSVPGLYDEDQLPLWESLETKVRRVGGWSEMAARMRGRELLFQNFSILQCAQQ
jgi:hypothetical protein